VAKTLDKKNKKTEYFL